MTQDPPADGCFQWLLTVMVSLLPMGLFMAGNEAPVSQPPVNDVALVIVAEPERADFTTDDLSLAAAVLDTRLEAQGVLAAPTRVEGNQLVGSVSQEPNAATITDVGYLEFVDFADIEDPAELNAFVGRAIVTDTQLEQFGAALNGDAQPNPVTGMPFTTVLGNEGIATSVAAEDTFSGGGLVEFTFTQMGGATMGTFTAENIGEPLAIVVDGVVIAVPVIQSPLDTAGIITGNFTQEEAQALAAQIQAEPLPFPLVIVSIAVAE